MYADKYKISVIDNFGYASQANRIKELKNVEVYNCDVSNKKEVYDVFKELYGIDGIIHGAALSHVDNSIESPEPFIYSNIVGTFNILEAAKDFSIPNVLYISTDETIEHTMPIEYREANGLFPENRNMDGPTTLYFSRKRESSSRFKPSSVYSASKASGEMLAMSYRSTYGMKNLTTVRLCNQYGPYQHKEKLIPKTITRALAGEKIPVFETSAYRDWCYITDGCRAIDLLLNLKKREDLYHISAYNETQTLDIVKQVLRLMNKDDSLIEMVKDRRGYDLVYSIDSEKIRSLGWSPEISLEEGLKRTIDHYEKNIS